MNPFLHCPLWLIDIDCTISIPFFYCLLTAWCVRGFYDGHYFVLPLAIVSLLFRSEYYYLLLLLSSRNILCSFDDIALHFIGSISCIILCRPMYRTQYFIDIYWFTGELPGSSIILIVLRHSGTLFYLCRLIYDALSSSTQYIWLLSYIEWEDCSNLWAHHYYYDYDVYILLHAGSDAFIPSACYIASTHWLLRTLSDLTLFCHHLWNHCMLSYWLLLWYAQWLISA